MNAVAERNPNADNPFGHPAIAARQSEALVAVEQSRAIAETQAAMVIAKKFPRNPIESMDRILNACTRPTLAEQALYTYSRGGTDITGPSIRMAEAIAQCWGNIQWGIRELEQRAGESTVEAFAWDIESNARQVKVFQVKHERHTRQGSKLLTDPRDIYETVANQGARRLRACILGVIPGDVIDAATQQCEATLATKAEVTEESIAKLLEAFAGFGVTKDQIEKRLQRRLDAMTPAQLVSMRKIYNSLKDGMSAPADWFEAAPGAAASGDGAEAKKPSGATRLREAAKGAVERGAEAKKPAEPQPSGPALSVDFETALLDIDKASDSEVAALVLDSARGHPRFAELEEAFRARWVVTKGEE